MRYLAFLLGIWIGSTTVVLAQAVDVEVTVDDSQFLPGESIPVSLRVANHSGQTLHFDADRWLTYSVEARDGMPVSKIAEPPPGVAFDLETGKAATLHSDLGPYFDFSRSGQYKVTATVALTEWGKEVSGSGKPFDIVRGFKVWETEFGVPQGETNHAPPEIRRYILQQVSADRHSKLYMRVTDGGETRTIRLQPIGAMVSFIRPQTQLDAHNNLHLLFEEGPRTFNYSVFTPDGERITHQTYGYSDDGPHLKMAASGAVSISGGVRHVLSSDVPRPKDSTHNDETPPKL